LDISLRQMRYTAKNCGEQMEQESGTYMVKDIFTGSGGSSLSMNLFGGAVSGGFFFMATTSAEGAELWFSDGTASGTALVKDI